MLFNSEEVYIKDAAYTFSRVHVYIHTPYYLHTNHEIFTSTHPLFSCRWLQSKVVALFASNWV